MATVLEQFSIDDQLFGNNANDTTNEVNEAGDGSCESNDDIDIDGSEDLNAFDASDALNMDESQFVDESQTRIETDESHKNAEPNVSQCAAKGSMRAENSELNSNVGINDGFMEKIETSISLRPRDRNRNFGYEFNGFPTATSLPPPAQPLSSYKFCGFRLKPKWRGVKKPAEHKHIWGVKPKRSMTNYSRRERSILYVPHLKKHFSM